MVRAIMRPADGFSNARDATPDADKIPEITAGFPFRLPLRLLI
jgi:hypothetical protein